ncbi:hypothetical protein JTE90_001754 [Oedothorax gibbosus]|uniref:Aminoglycoside phosphotransferase domain-containing protein n=1 Tax=Oedothorax gibbosus TaxID=931172 RepID=A0AAV6TJM6_9ARAC|nr:hypothetical protein JTE90_001754 [Oedothorax gibbosus]
MSKNKRIGHPDLGQPKSVMGVFEEWGKSFVLYEFTSENVMWSQNCQIFIVSLGECRSLESTLQCRFICLYKILEKTGNLAIEVVMDEIKLNLKKSVEHMDKQNEDKNTELILKYISGFLNITFVGSRNESSLGNTTSHIILETDKGTLCIRFYPKNHQKLETGNPLFEIKALQFLKKNGFNVPVPLSIEDEYYFENSDQIIFCYFLIPGTPIPLSELSVDLAAKIGTYLNDFLKASVLYFSKECVFINTFRYILEIAEKVENTHSTISSSSTWKIMKSHTEVNISILDGTPKGLVHADCFYENILRDGGGNVIGLIDFGDAYYGHLLHDVAIGAMEASVLQGEVWSLENVSSFLKAVTEFLMSYNISFEQFYETLKVDCFRFALYTFSK